MDEKEVKGIKLWKIIIILGIIVSLYPLFIILTSPKETQTEINSLSFENQRANNLSFEKIKIYKENDSYYFTAKVINNSSNDIKMVPVTITLSGDERTVFTSYINSIDSHDYQMIFMETKKDIMDTKDINIKVQE